PLRELLLLELLLLELVARAVPAVESERLEDQPILLGHVIATLALGGAGPLRTRRVRKRNLARDDRAEARPDVGERAHVARLLLRPHHLLQVRIRSDKLFERLGRERIEQLHSRDRRVLRLVPPVVAG